MAPSWNVVDRLPCTLDETELLHRAREAGDTRAAEFLLSMHGPWLNRLIARQGKLRGLKRHEIEDAQLEAGWVAMRTFAHFDEGMGCGLRTYLASAAMNQLRNFVRKRNSAEHLYDHSAPAARLLHDGPDGTLPGAPLHPSEGGREDPARLAERHEALGKVEEVLDQEGDLARRLWEGLVANRSLPELATELGRTYKQLRTLTRHLRVAIRARLRSFMD